MGQNVNSVSCPSRQHSMAVWSSEPPKVPTPRRPSNDPKLSPFSIVAR